MKNGVPKGGASKGGGPKFRAFSSILSHLLGVLSWNFGGV